MTTVPNYFNQTLGYYASLPRGYHDDVNRRWPLLVFLHGIGERGNGTTELSRVLGQGLARRIRDGEQLEFTVDNRVESFVVIMPQLQSGSSEWHPFTVDRAIEVGRTFRVDDTRIYLTGLSLGGFGTDRYPEASDAFAMKVAAIAPTDGMNTGTQIYTPNVPNDSLVLDHCRIGRFNVPVWAFFGANDNQWGWTQQSITTMNACTPAPNPAVRLTTYPGVGHSGWTLTYTTDHSVHNPNVYEWLLQHHR